MRLALAACLLTVAATTALADDRPPPAPNDPDDFVRYIFETNGCVLTEAQLTQIYQDAGYGLMGANNATIAVSDRDDIEVLDRNPFRYRYYGSDYCGF